MFHVFNKVFGSAILFILLSGVFSYAQGASASASWVAVTNTVGGTPITGVTYNLYRSPNADMSAKVKLNSTNPITGVSFTDTTAPTATDVYYQVHGISPIDGSEGQGSVIVKFNTNNRIPMAPGSFQVK